MNTQATQAISINDIVEAYSAKNVYELKLSKLGDMPEELLEYMDKLKADIELEYSSRLAILEKAKGLLEHVCEKVEVVSGQKELDNGNIHCHDIEHKLSEGAKRLLKNIRLARAYIVSYEKLMNGLKNKPKGEPVDSSLQEIMDEHEIHFSKINGSSFGSKLTDFVIQDFVQNSFKYNTEWFSFKKLQR